MINLKCEGQKLIFELKLVMLQGSFEYLILVSIVVSIPACHAGDRGSIPRRGEYLFETCSWDTFQLTVWTVSHLVGIFFAPYVLLPRDPNPLMFPESAFITKWLLAKIEKLWTTRKMIHQAVNGLHMQFFSHVKNSKSSPPKKVIKKNLISPWN